MSEPEVIARIEAFKLAVIDWCKGRDLWEQAEFRDWLEYHDDEPPEYPCAAFLVSDGPLAEAWNGYHDYEYLDGFDELISSLGFEWELQNGYSANFYFPENDPAIPTLSDMMEWQWICGLLKPDFSSLYGEIFDRFLKNPDELRRINHRQFEILLDGIFRNNGYRTELGKGSGDGGVDIRLYHNDVIGEALTLVQAKQFALHRPIELGAVQALAAAVDDERANRGLFVTTSRYLPGSQVFAARQNTKLNLADADNILRWSENAKIRIARDKAGWVSREHVISTLKCHNDQIRSGNRGLVLHATYGYECTRNRYALILKESNGAALLMELPNRAVQGDGQDGLEVPVTELSALAHHNAERVFRVKKSRIRDRESYWGDGNLFSAWDGSPKIFNTR
jgi:hypothetical protein